MSELGIYYFYVPMFVNDKQREWRIYFETNVACDNVVLWLTTVRAGNLSDGDRHVSTFCNIHRNPISCIVYREMKLSGIC